ncbi:MAG: hypothetical protein KME56_12395 [Candidatus Thiodiazotropha sp. (ex Ctena orbiculata)]|nr:hypothetical protein [Candidatus Thiodiazotropha taylori]MBT2997420.1 hypothetical protein [Candidatus Thiodiazotropha taylori]MBT3001094.1 hypothetical protein [Candidatus Thiodiazotropha taylori]MBV2107502.1 hypothetical protein [Candidatus Thiodiazotropha taylori]MBV2111941.1 hypothetical protein [Candidatus Thiodiazotropha taylori]
MADNEQSSIKSAKILKFHKKYSLKDRLAVLKVFVEFLKENKGNEISKPKRIIEDFYSHSHLSYDDIYELYYRKIENIKAGKTRGIDDPELFELIRDFVFRNAPKKIMCLSAALSIKSIGDALDYFFTDDRKSTMELSQLMKISSSRKKTDKSKYITLSSIDKNAIYKVGFSKWDGSDNDSTGIKKNLEKAYPNKIDIYLAMIDIYDHRHNFVILFYGGSVTDLYYGLNVIKSDIFILKNWQYGDPLSIQYKQDEWDREDNDRYMLRAGKALTVNGVSEITNSERVGEEFMNDHWKYRNWLELVKGKEKDDALAKARMIFDRLVENRNL